MRTSAAGAAVTVAEMARPVELLDVHEHQRRNRFVDGRAARAYVELHVLARSEIGRLLGRAPGSLRFDRACADCGRQHGAPRLLDDPGLHLSLSRTSSFVALALTRHGRVGIDVEEVVGTQFSGFTQVALHPDDRVLSASPETGHPVRTAMDDAVTWVRKEAALKALGVGLKFDPARVRTPPSGVAAEVLAGLPAVCVVDLGLDAGTGHAGAVALVTDASDVQVRRH